ncbi:hypothetical protein GCM10023093_24500 [Nemorincola caseinilytica]|uniref:BIG2 domain-containing protein n=1 Tax=Nemorincola caseinilytica TaxID=2054315 RepID=A0ABP8NM29_9BACT
MRRTLPVIFLSLILAPALYAQQPVITSVAPMQGHPGDNVLITGSGFNATTTNNIVYFGATKATVVSAGSTTLSATVPNGATYRPVSITNTASALTGASAMPFLPTYDNSAFDATVINFEVHADITNGATTVPYSIALADLDNDGKTDMIVANSGTNNITLYRNISTSGTLTAGSFEAGVSFATSQPPHDVTTGDIDGDGKLDIIVANSGTILSYVTIFRNTTTSGAFTAASLATRVDMSANANARGVAVGDLDMDGRPEVAVACLANTVNLFRNISTVGSITAGSFAPKENITPGAAPNKVAIAEIDGDGKPELIIVNSGSDNVSVFHNNSTPGTLLPSSFGTIVNFSTNSSPSAIVVADVDGDGKHDMCVANFNSNNVSVYRNTSAPGSITSGSFAARVNYATGTAPAEMVMSDINGDGKPDLLVSNYNALSFSVLRNTSTTGVIDAATFAPKSDVATVDGTRGLAAADLDGDTHPDVVCTGELPGLVALHRNDPFGHITGTTTVCISATTTLNITTTGGTWSSAAITIATVNAATGVVTGISAGTATIIYTVAGNSTSAIVTVNAAPTVASITGTASVCAGGTTALANTTPGGVWSSTNAAAGTVSASGVVMGIAAGTTTISYTVSSGCGTVVATTDVTVNALPVAGVITAAPPFCAGTNVTLTPSVAGGTWSTADAAATVGSSTGEVTGVSGGTATISYSVTDGCGTATATTVVTVNATPDAITGPLNVCIGATTTLNSTTTGGTWASGNTSLATVGAATGVVSGVGAGVVLISYSKAGCTTTALITVNITPYAGVLSGATTFCTGSDITLTSTMAGGSWSSADVSIATVGTSGIVTGVDDGTVTISYTMSNGCATSVATTIVTVEVTADTGLITGPPSVCAGGSTITLSNVVTTGTWSSSNPLAGTISTAGVVTGIDAGTTIISYTVSNSCGAISASQIVTVNPLPAPIAGTFAICKDATTVLTSSTPGGSWSASNTNVSVDALGVMTGVAAGTARVSYTLVIGCFRTALVTVNPLPGYIAGSLAVCMGSTSTLANPVTGGTWTSGNTAVATIGSTGIVTAVSPGTSVITYTKTSTGCYITGIVTVNPLPSAISGDLVLCTGMSDTFSCTPAGGTWSSSNYTIATVNSGTGAVYAVAPGTVRISYTAPSGCKAYVTVTVNQSPSAIMGPLAVCEGSTGTLTNTQPYGVWVSSNTVVGIISASGVVAGIAPGTSIVSYILPSGCARGVIVTINPLPTAVSGASALCTGLTTTLTGTPAGGTWVSSNTAMATVTSTTGVVTALNSGTVAISYVLSTGCKRPKTLTLNPTPSTIAGTCHACVGATTLLGSSPLTGTWSSGNTAIATIGSVAGLVSGIAAGTSVISYVMTATGCYTTAIVTIDPLPGLIEGPADLCVGSSALFAATPTGGTWSSSAPAVATAGILTGNITGVSAGTTIITYRSAAGCVGTDVLSVNALATAGSILGTPTVCQSNTVTLTATVAGGSWSVVTGKVSITPAGVLTGVAGGVDTVKYTATNGCGTAVARYTITVNPLPAIGSISGIDSFCLGSTAVLTASVVGGVWSSSNEAVVTVAGGITTPVSAGTATISYSRTNACGTAVATMTVAVITPIVAGTISGPDTVCYANTVTLTSTAPGGIWNSSSPYVSVESTTGKVTGIAPGKAIIRHIVKNDCSADTAFFPIYVKYSIDCPTAVTPTAAPVAGIRVYPTPTDGMVTIETPVAGVVTIHTIDGKEVSRYVVNASATEMNLPRGLAQGMYMCRFVGNDGSTAVLRIVYEP